MSTFRKQDSLCSSHKFLITLLTVHCVATEHSSQVPDEVKIECGEHPETSMVNVTYFGEAESAYPIRDQKIIDTCGGEYRPDGTLVLTDVNHRNCTFTQVGQTKAWTINVKVQRKYDILTALDKEFAFTCVYDDFEIASTP